MVIDNGRFLTSELSNIAQMLEEHFRSAMSAIRIMMNGLTEWLDSNKAIDPTELKKITEMEEKGDELKRQILIELAKANSLMQREDLLRLVHYNDKLVDGAEIWSCSDIKNNGNVFSPGINPHNEAQDKS